MKIKNRIQAFTLIEVIITLTILALIFSSVMSVFVYYSAMGSKVEANRIMQSNIKNIVEHIGSDVRENGIKFSSTGHSILTGMMYDNTTDILYIGKSRYYIAKEVGGVWIKVDSSDFETKCQPIGENCSLVKNIDGKVVSLSNSWISFKDISFYVSSDYIPKVTIAFNIGIAHGKGIKISLIEKTNITFQTTLSEKLISKN